MGIADSPLRDQTLFVEGAPRSGTSWLTVLLATHPEIAGTSTESHLFDKGVAALYDAYERTGPQASLVAFVTREELLDLVRELCDGVLLKMRARLKPDARLVVEKTPLAASPHTVMRRKVECYPDAWYLHIVRERESVVRSLMRAPFMEDSSRTACEGLWDGAVGAIRELAGELPRYREVRYEDLSEDPVAGLSDIFGWLDADSSPDVLETVRRLTQEPYSGLRRSARSEPAASRRPRPAAARAAAARLRHGLVRRQPRGTDGRPKEVATWQLVFDLVSAAGRGEVDAVRELTTDGFLLEFRSGAGDLRVDGEEGRTALAAISEVLFTRRFVTTSWTASEGEPFSTVMFGALKGDASRVDLLFHGVRSGDRIERLIGVAPGDPAGRPPRTWKPS